jgi:SAM-dependent methyltransferase
VSFPLPPAHLQLRVGGSEFDYLHLGERCREHFLELLPRSFDFTGARVLDFGAGAGRTLRAFAPEAEVAELWGCDIDAESVEWMQANLCPPFHAFRNDELPPLPFEDDSFDLVYCFSVFSHLADNASAWIAELHRILKPGGILLPTFMGAGAEAYLGRPWDEDRVGFLVTMARQDFVGTHGGPMVFYSEWWIREHWGRAFDVLEHWPWGVGVEGPDGPRIGQGCVTLRKRPVAITAADIDRPSDDPRERAALEENLEVLHDRERIWRERATALEAELAALRGSRAVRVAQTIGALRRPWARRRRSAT